MLRFASRHYQTDLLQQMGSTAVDGRIGQERPTPRDCAFLRSAPAGATLKAIGIWTNIGKRWSDSASWKNFSENKCALILLKTTPLCNSLMTRGGGFMSFRRTVHNHATARQAVHAINCLDVGKLGERIHALLTVRCGERTTDLETRNTLKALR